MLLRPALTLLVSLQLALETSATSSPSASPHPASPSKVISLEGIGNASWAVPADKTLPKRQLDWMGEWSETGCYENGYKRPTAHFIQAAENYCNAYNFQLLSPGSSFDYTYHMCYSDDQDHKLVKWLSVQVQPGSEPLCMEYADCVIMMQDFVQKTCPPDDQKQGGWGINNHGYLFVDGMFVDGDPDLHNPGQAYPSLDCGDEKAVKALVAARPIQRMQNEEWKCPL